MTPTYEDLQAAPSAPRLLEIQTRDALDASAGHLLSNARRLAGPNPNHREALNDALQSIRASYTALLAWNHLTPGAAAPLAELARTAESFASMLRTCRNRTGALEALDATVRGDASPTVAVREAVETSYYTARNTLAVVLGSLPERITEEALHTLNRAQAARIGWLKPAPEANEAANAPRRPVTATAMTVISPRLPTGV